MREWCAETYLSSEIGELAVDWEVPEEVFMDEGSGSRHGFVWISARRGF